MNTAHGFYRIALNPLMNRLLRSRWHGVISNRVFAITYTGTKTGKHYSIPVAYFADGDDLYCFTDGNWWKNFVAEKNVQIILRGKTHAALAHSCAGDTDAIANVMQRVFTRQSYYASHFGVVMNADGSANHDSVRAAANGLAMITIRFS